MGTNGTVNPHAAEGSDNTAAARAATAVVADALAKFAETAVDADALAEPTTLPELLVALARLLELPAEDRERESVRLQGPTQTVLFNVRVEAILCMFRERSLDPSDPAALASLAADLGVTPQAIRKLLSKAAARASTNS